MRFYWIIYLAMFTIFYDGTVYNLHPPALLLSALHSQKSLLNSIECLTNIPRKAKSQPKYINRTIQIYTVCRYTQSVVNKVKTPPVLYYVNHKNNRDSIVTLWSLS